MKIYISADIEGATGTTHGDETRKGHADYTPFQEQMTAEVVAACEGALLAGATEVWVKDAHWTARNIIAARLPREIRLIREWAGHPFGMMQELDETFDAALMLGYHSRAGSSTSPLAHTMTDAIGHIRINGVYASEFLINAYTAGLTRVPVAFLSGDAGICEEAKSFLPALTTVAVMQGVGGSTISIHPALAVDKIRAGVEASLRGNLAACRVAMPDHFFVEVRYKQHPRAYSAGFYPGASLVGPDSIQFEADHYLDVLKFFYFCIA